MALKVHFGGLKHLFLERQSINFNRFAWPDPQSSVLKGFVDMIQSWWYNLYMKRSISQSILLILLASFCIIGFLLVKHILQLPFGQTNDALHKKGSAITLDLLIPSGIYIDDTMTIGEVVKIRTKKETSFYETLLKSIADLIPARYRHVANFIIFLFWVFLFMTFFRVFTFMGYGRALRGSLFLGGLVYFFMPDFSPEKIDDTVFIGIPLSIIILRAYISRRKKKRDRVDVI